MLLSKGRLLSTAQLKRLGEHKYSCSSCSLLDPFMQPWWNWLVGKVPLWLAPNLITVLGLSINILTSLVLVYYSPDAKQEVPRWACFLCAMGLFIYQSLDAIDGKQARRTGTSSPLGELFDHGCDSLSTVFAALAACISCQLGIYPGWVFYQCFVGMTLFYCAHWQTYVSGTLRFGKFDVTEAQFGLIAVHLTSAIFGSSVWALKIPAVNIELKMVFTLVATVPSIYALYNYLTVVCTGGVGKNGSTVAVPAIGISLKILISIAVIGIGALTLQSQFTVVLTGGVGKNGSTVALPYVELEIRFAPVVVALLISWMLAQSHFAIIFTGGVGKNGSTVAGTSVLSPIIPFGLVVVPAFIIYRKSIEHVYENHPALYIIAFGLVSAKVTNRLVVAHMTKSELDYLDSALLGPAMLFLNQYFNFFIKEYYVLWLCLLWVIVDLFRYCSQVCLEICEHLRIRLFKITPNPPPPSLASSDRNGMSSAALARIKKNQKE